MPSRVPEGLERGWIVPIGGAENKENDRRILERFVRCSGGAAADLVVIPTKVSGMDLQEVFRTYEVVQRAERMLKRPIAARVLLTQMSPLGSRVAVHARHEIQQANIPVMHTEIIARAAYQSMHFTGATPSHPSGDPKAAREIQAVLVEIVEILAQQEQAAA